MENEQDKYIIGFCKWCNQCKAIKSGVCFDCGEHLKDLTGNEWIDKLLEGVIFK